MAWIKLTQLDGAAVFVSGDQIVRVRPPATEAPSANAVVDFTNGQVQAVLETIPQVVALLSGDAAGQAAGGDDRLV